MHPAESNQILEYVSNISLQFPVLYMHLLTYIYYTTLYIDDVGATRLSLNNSQSLELMEKVFLILQADS